MSDSPTPTMLAAAGAFVDAVRAFEQACRAWSRAEVPEALRLPGVHRAHLAVLRVLARGPAATVADLATRVRVDATTISGTLPALAAHGLVTRPRDPNDRRRIGVALSEQGRAAVQDLSPDVSEWLVAALTKASGSDDSGATAADLAACAATLYALSLRLGTVGDFLATGPDHRVQS